MGWIAMAPPLAGELALSSVAMADDDVTPASSASTTTGWPMARAGVFAVAGTAHGHATASLVKEEAHCYEETKT